MQSLSILVADWPQSSLAFAVKTVTVVVLARAFVRVAQPLRTFMAILALLSRYDWRRAQAMKILEMLLEHDKSKLKATKTLKTRK